jgi:membrane protease YdiL (CAAX protease family)
VLAEKPWRPEAVLLLGAVTCFSALIGMATIRFLAGPDASNLQAKPTFLSFLGGTLFFHGAGLAWTHVFLRKHGTGWSDGFGLAQGGAAVLKWACLGLAVILPGALFLGRISSWVLNTAGIVTPLQGPVQLLVSQPAAWQTVIYGVGAIVLAPAAEETLFRGILYPTLKQSGHPRLALWVTSLMFAASHMNLMAFVPMVFIALVLTWLYERTGNLLTSCLTHALFNAVNFTLLVAKPSLVAPG